MKHLLLKNLTEAQMVMLLTLFQPSTEPFTELTQEEKDSTLVVDLGKDGE